MHVRAHGGPALIASLLASCALFAVVLAPAGHAQLPTCAPGTTNTLYCQVGPPIVKAASPSTACRSVGARFRVPTATVSAVGGLARVVVKLDGRTIKTVKTSANSYTLKGLTIATRGLKAGLHTVTITAVDKAGRSGKRTLHFAICKPKPKFTG